MTDSLKLIPNQQIQRGEKIGEGGFGLVFKGIWENNQVAIKTLRLQKLTEELKQEFTREARVMAKLSHANIIRFYGVCLEPGHYAMLMELMPQGDLYHLLANKNQKLPGKLRWNIAIDIGEGLAHLHANKVIHRDLKSLNILLDQNLRAKITDFGLSKIKLHTSTLYTNRSGGSTPWMAPELFGRGQTKLAYPADVYAYGMILWEIASRKIPFSDAVNPAQVIGWIIQGEREKISNKIPKLYAELIWACWKAEPEERPTAAEALSSLKQGYKQTYPPQPKLPLPGPPPPSYVPPPPKIPPSSSKDLLPSPYDSKSLDQFPEFRALSLPKSLSGKVGYIDTRVLLGHEGLVTTLLELSGRQLVSGSRDKTIKVWSVEDEKCLMTLRGHTETVRKLVELSDQYIASGSVDKTIRIWNWKERKCIGILKGHKRPITALTANGENMIVSGDESGAIKVWNWRLGTCNMTIKEGEWVKGLEKLPGGKFVSIGDYGCKVKIRGFENGKCFREYTIEHEYPNVTKVSKVNCSELFADRWLICTTTAGTIGVVDLDKNKTSTFQNSAIGYKNFALLSSGLLVSLATSCLWILDWKYEESWALCDHKDPSNAIGALSDGRLAVAEVNKIQILGNSPQKKS